MGDLKQLSGKSFQTSTTTTKKLAFHFCKFIFLISLMVLLAGHETSNPKFGNSLVDFYFEESKVQIETQSKILLLNSEFDSTGNIESYINKLTVRFYELRNFYPVWTYNFNTTEFFKIFINFVDSLDYKGIPERVISSKQLNTLCSDFNIYNEDENLKHRISLEIHTTRLFFKTMLFIHNGIFSHDTSSHLAAYIETLPEKSETAFKTRKLQELFYSVQPQFLPYRNLVKSSPHFIESRRLIRNFGIDTLKKNDSILATNLYYAGLLSKPVFDSISTKEVTLRNIQRIYRLEQTGELDDQTFEKIVFNFEKRFFQMCLNMDRLRKLNHHGDDYLFVNIPSFKLLVVKQQTTATTFNVVVGKTISPTPVLSSKIEKIVANPFWTVPKKIARNEMFDKIRNDSTFLKRNGYMIINNREEVVSDTLIDWSSVDPLGNKYWIRQKYGRGNALGQVKFLFPNNFRVYLHDTPSKKLFKRSYRAYSHGCIRIENPTKLAQYLIDNYTSSLNQKLNINSLIRTKQRNVIQLPIEIPIHIQYLTCMGNENGEMVFYPDIYKQDEARIKEIFKHKSRI